MNIEELIILLKEINSNTTYDVSVIGDIVVKFGEKEITIKVSSK